MIPNYQAKFEYLYLKQNGRCAIATSHGRIAAITELHHAGRHNTGADRKLYPLLVNSLWNLVAVNHLWHMKYPAWGKQKGTEWASKREAFLGRHPRIAKKLNMEE